MIIDIHGHYTTAPKALEEWRNRQIAGIKDPSQKPTAVGAENQRRRTARDRSRPISSSSCASAARDLTIFSPRASFMAHHIGDFEVSSTWAAICNELCFRVAKLFPGQFHRRGHAAAVPGRRSEDLHSRARKMREGLRLRRDQPEPRPLRRPLDEPAADRPALVSDLREDGRIRHSRDGACLDELQRLLPHHRRALHQRRHDGGHAV